MKKLLSVLLAMAMVLSFASSCISANVVETQTVTETAAAKTVTVTETKTVEQEAATTYIFTDSVGREVEVPYEINTIIPSGPLAQMMLIAIAPEKINALAAKLSDSQKGYLPDYLWEKTYVGQLYGSANLNRETLAGIGCDLIIDLGEPKNTIVEDMDNLTEQTGIPAVHITASIFRSGEAYRTLGKLLGCEERGNELADYCENVCSDLLSIIRATANDKLSVAYVTYNGDNSVNVVARNSYHAEVLDLLFNNVAVVSNPSGKGTGNQVDLEQLLAWDPDVIIFSSEEGYTAVASGKANDVWYELTAIKNGTYYEIPTVPYSWFGGPPSVNRLIGIEWYIAMFYNTDYGVTVDLKEAVKEYYKLFYSCDVTDAQYEALIANSYAKIAK